MTQQQVKMIANKGIATDKKNEAGYPIYEDKVALFYKTIESSKGTFDIIDISIDKEYLKQVIKEQETYEKENGKEYTSYKISANWNKKYEVLTKQTEKKVELPF